MGRKRQGPTHSQTLGIIWLSAALLLLAVIVFFSSRHAVESTPDDSSATLHEEILTTKEDSVYRTRRQYRYNQQKPKEKHPTKPSFYTTVPPAPTKQPLSVELNSADTLTLQLLHGIGPAYASRIVRYRDRLGGFVSTSQLLEVYGVTPELVDHLSPHLRLDTGAIRRIHINTIDLKALARHPYVEYYQARDIVRLRSLGIRFHSADDLRAVPSMADSTLQRLLPYLDFGDTLATN